MIRKAEAQDLTAIKELWIELIDFHGARDAHYTRSSDGHGRFGEFVADNIESPNWLVLVAVDGARVVGYCMAAIMEYPPVFERTHYGFVADIAVTERYRGQGIGTQLFERTVPWFREKGTSRIELNVASTNEVSQPFWKSMGFEDFVIRLVKEL